MVVKCLAIIEKPKYITNKHVENNKDKLDEKINKLKGIYNDKINELNKVKYEY